jgi:hypothetical protein
MSCFCPYSKSKIVVFISLFFCVLILSTLNTNFKTKGEEQFIFFAGDCSKITTDVSVNGNVPDGAKEHH